MHLADLVQKQYAAVRARHRPFLGLRHAALSQRSRALIDGVVNAAKERVGDGALVKAQAGCVHLHERRVFAEGRARRALGRFQRQTRRAGLAHARRAVDQHMLGILSAEHRLERAHSLLLADDLIKAPRAHGLVERPGKADGAQAAHVLRLGAGFAAARGPRVAVAAKLAEKVDAHDQAEQYLHDGQKLRHICPPGFPGAGRGRRAFRQTFCPFFWEIM